MRVAFFLPDLNVGGAERMTLRLLRHLDRSRVQPVLILLQKRGRLLDHVPSDVPVVDLGRSSRLLLPRAAARLGPALREHRVRILLAEIEVPTLVSLVSRPLLPRGLVLGMIEHSIPSVALPPKTPLVPLYRRIYRKLDLVIAVSHRGAEDLRANFGVPKVHVIPNPIDLAELRRPGPAPHPWLEESVPTLVSVGRLDPQKGHDVLLKAFEIARSKARARLLIFGEGRMKLRLPDDAALGGHLDPVGPALLRATVFALASRVEGFPLAVAEAMACGTPVAVTEPAGRELIRHGQNGLVVPAEDPGALAEALLSLLRSEDLRRSLSERARADAAAFDAPAIARRYEDLLEAAAHPPASRGVE